MAVIINIETSNTACSVALTAQGFILHHLENLNGKNHAANLSDYIKAMLDFAAEKEIKIDAVAVSIGPGSYTGLRIGLSEAKGLAYGLNVPLIGVPTLPLMATKVMFQETDISENTIFVPMIDARRMEVYTAAYDIALQPVIQPAPLIIEQQYNPYSSIISSGKQILFFGDGMPKWRKYLQDNAINISQAKFIENIEPLAVDMIALSEKNFAQQNFLDTAYSTPLYLKDFQATKPKNKIIGG